MRLPLAIVLLLCCLPAFAQAPIERRMTAEQFKAAGLDKLSAAELAHLNAWLDGTIEAETSKAAVQAKKKVEDDNRGFFNFGSPEPVVSRLSGDFRGFAQGRVYALANGQSWRQVDAATLAGVRMSAPEVRIAPSMVGNAWYMSLPGYNTRAKVERVK